MSSKGITITSDTDVTNDLIVAYVARGKHLINEVRNHQIEISKMCISLCTIRHGGISNNIYTISDYANDIGMNKSTLSNWVRMYKDVVLKLPAIQQIDVDFQTVRKVNERIRKEQMIENKVKGTVGRVTKKKEKMPKKKIQSLYNTIKEESPFVDESLRCLASAKHIKHIYDKRDLRLGNRTVLNETMVILDKVSDIINDFLTNGSK